MSIIQKVDGWLMSEVFEPLAWKVEYRYGICNIELSRRCYMATLVSVPLIGIVCGSISVLLFGIVGGPLAMWALDPFWKSIKKGPRATRNRMRDEWQLRFVMICTMIIMCLTSTAVLIIATTGSVPGIVATMLGTCISAIGFICFSMCEWMPPGFREHEKSLVPSPT